MKRLALNLLLGLIPLAIAILGALASRGHQPLDYYHQRAAPLRADANQGEKP